MQLTLLILLSLASYRIARFLILDTLIDTPRINVHGWLLGKQGRVRHKVYELVTCPYCLTVWVAAALTAATNLFTPMPLPVLMWLATCGGSLLAWQVIED